MERDPRADVSPAHLAALAGLRLSDDEAGSFGNDLDRILAYMSLLSEVDTTGIAPLASPTAGASPLREDVPLREVSAAAVVALAPKSQDGAFVVPKILE